MSEQITLVIPIRIIYSSVLLIQSNEILLHTNTKYVFFPKKKKL